MKQRQPGLLGQAFDHASDWLGLGEQSPSPSNGSLQEELGESGVQEEGGGGLLDFLLGGGSGVGGAPAAPPVDADGGPPASPGAPGAPGAYVVQAGDTVGNIAERGTGDRGKYVELNAHNLRAPNDGDLEPGDVLRIPSGWDLAALQRSGSQAPGPASAGAAEAGFDPTAALPPLIQVQMLLGQDGDADKEELAELWAQMSEGEQQTLLSMGPLAEEARRVLELPADAPADAGFMQGVLDVASGLASEGAEVLDSAQSGAKEWWNGSAQEQSNEAPGESAEQLPEFFSDPVSSLRAWWAGEEEAEVETESGAVDLDKLEAHESDAAEGKTDVLDQAVRLADTSDAGHIYDGNSRSSVPGLDDLRSGEIATLEAIGCNEFVAAAFAAAGYDDPEVWNSNWRDLKDQRQIAYWGNHEGRAVFVTVGMVLATYQEATAAVVAVQSGTADLIQPGSDEAKATKGLEGITEAVYYIGTDGQVKGREASTDDRFGAALAVEAFGGEEVPLKARRPGDLQQSFTASGGYYTGVGHATIVHAVKGHGVARLGVNGAPDVEGEVRSPGPLDELDPGWYRIEEGSGLQWSITGATEASTVASFEATDVQVIDANREKSADASGQRRGSDATQVGAFDEHEDFDADSRDSKVYSSGRLPSSPWFAWTPSEPDAQILSTEAPVAAEDAAQVDEF